VADHRVIKKWDSGSPAIVGWMTTHSLLVAQSVAASGVDAVVVDMQHGSATLDDVLGLAACIEVRGAEPFVRLPAIDAGLIGRLLDSGVTGIIAPLVESAAQARQLMDAVLYPPLGGRSYGPRVPAIRWGSTYAQRANSQLVTLAMIETAAGMAALDAILSVDELTGVFVGPSDLGMSLGHSPPHGRMPDDVAAAIEQVRSRAESLGKRTGIFCPTTNAAESALSAGFDLVTSIPDLSLVDAGTKAQVETLRKIIVPNAE
jgi:4-hydroxy-2-oxoheptanedioate aldolase